MKRVILSATILILLFSFGCKEQFGAKVEGNSASSKKIVITGHTSEFKQTLISEIVEKYKEIAQIEITDYKSAKKINPENYDALIVMDQVEAWMMFNGKTKKIIKNSNNAEKIIVVITAGDPDWKWSDEDSGIDAITGPSEIARKDDILNQIYSKLDNLLEK